jgi:4-amino-4-deoxy-L-arabinose transferase-like glycosyltransferase
VIQSNLKSHIAHRNLIFILVVFIALGVTYSVITPLFEAPDEVWHYLYVQNLTSGQGLPVLTGRQGTLLDQKEAHQPPLYYALGAALTFWIDSSNLPQVAQRNPFAAIGAPSSDGNKNVVLHGTDDEFPYHGAALAVHIVRLLSVLLGAATVTATYMLARELFPEQRWLAEGSAAFVAFNPQFLFVSGAVSNDALVTTLSAWTLVLLVRVIKTGLTPMRVVVLGLLIATATLSKLAGLGLLPLAILVIGIAAWRRRSLGMFLAANAALIAIVAIFDGWWFVRNVQLYGDPLASAAMVAVFGTRKIAPTPPDLLRELIEADISFWAVFGWMNVLADEIVYVFVRLLPLLALLGFIVTVWHNRYHSSRITHYVLHLAIVVLWMVIVTASLVQWTSQVTGPQGRLLFPALPAIALFLVLGISQLVARAWRPRLIAFVSSVLFLIALAMPIRIIAPAYARPPVIAESSLPAEMPRLGIVFEKQIELIGYQIDKTVVKPGDSLTLTLYFRGLAPMPENYVLFIHAFGHDGQPIGQRDSYPGRGSLPTTQWRPGEILADTYRVPIAPDAAGPTAARIEVGFYTLAPRRSLQAIDGAGQPLGTSPRIVRFKVLAPSEPMPASATPVRFILGDMIALVGYTIDKPTARPGETVRLTLWWQPLATVSDDYTVFVHLIDAQDGLHGQHDSQPQGGDYPTSLWEPGEFIRDEYAVVVDPATLAGRYRFEVGMYLLVTGARLPAKDAAGQPIGDRVLLGPIEVKP